MIKVAELALRGIKAQPFKMMNFALKMKNFAIQNDQLCRHMCAQPLPAVRFLLLFVDFRPVF